MSVTSNGQQASAVDLPQPLVQRWQPLRGGLFNLYQYQLQEFWYDHGRLLLRGNNGTGKSRVLALQLPLLLDGEMLPARVEPDGDPAKRIEWNLLMNRHEDRLGYTWLEFGRQVPGGGAEFWTIGIGMHARVGRGVPNRWYFVTSQRIGLDLQLQSAHGNLLPRDRLSEAIDDRGKVLLTARDYRREVDRALFRLGRERYSALLELLLQLRRPQLSRDLNEANLSNALSLALPPVEPRILADVADAFRGLDRDREDLDGFNTAQQSVERFLVEYVPYAQMAARRRAADVRSRHYAYEQVRRRLRQAEQDRDAAELEVQRLVERMKKLELKRCEAEARIQQLQDSPAMKDAWELDRLSEQARRLANELQERIEDSAEATARHRRTRSELDDADADTAEAANHTASAAETVSASAAAARLTELYSAMQAAMSDEPLRAEASAALRTDALERLDSRQAAVRHLQQLFGAWESAERQRHEADRRRAEQQGQLEEALAGHAESRAAVTAEVRATLATYDAWCAACTMLASDQRSVLEEPLLLWTEADEGDSPLAQAVQRAYLEVSDDIARRRASQLERLQQHHADMAELDQQLATLREGAHVPPQVPHTRTAERDERAGRPLWQLLDFRDDVPEADRAGLEAALEAAGLLDAWVTPDGVVQSVDQLDTFIDVSSTQPLDPNDHAGRVLKCDDTAADGDVAVPTIQAVIERIGLGRTGAALWIDASGAWGNGPLTGRWSKPHAQHVGAAAREAHRQRSLRRLQEQHGEIQQALDQVEQSLEALGRSATTAEAERQQAPSDAPIRTAMARVQAAASEVVRSRERVAAAEAAAIASAEVVQAARQQLEADAADVGLAEEVDDLESYRDRLMHYREATLAWLTAYERWRISHANLVAARARAVQAEAAVDRCRTAEERAQLAARDAEVRRDTLQRAKGASIETIHAELDAARGARQELDAALVHDRELHGGAREQRARATQQVDSETGILAECEEVRDKALDRMRGFVEAGLLNIAAAEVVGEAGDLSSTTAAVALARRLEQKLTRVPEDEASWERTHTRLHHSIQTLEQALLPHDIRPESSQPGGLWQVSAPFRGQRMDLYDLRGALHDEVAQRNALLEHKEREVLENTLVGELATHLHQRLRDGDRLVQEMNTQIESRPMSTGMRLRFKWELDEDGPEGLREARQRLIGAAGTWSTEDRIALGSFLQAQIQRCRLEDEAGTWEDHLARALDYRQWHSFAVLRYQQGKWMRLTRRTHGTGSGGEKAVALTLPLFAAAAAHYDSAMPDAPRLVMLDEAFVGIDADMRRKCMGLLATFDLDFVITSEREWGCYDTLPGVAIYQLSGQEGIDAVFASRWVWNGQQRVQVDHSDGAGNHA